MRENRPEWGGVASPRDDWRERWARRGGPLLLVAGVLLWGGIGTGGRADRSTRVAELSATFVEVARQVEPSVVNITTVSRPMAPARPGTGSSQTGRSSIEGLSQQNRLPARRGNGSGIILDPAGYILTNHHVVHGADRIRVTLAGGRTVRASLIGDDRETDLAVIKIDPPYPLPTIRVGDSARMRVGDWVLAIGSPFGFDQTVTAGIISSRERDSSELYRRVGFQYFLQTDAAINRGNSGGPLINLEGEVIGINTAIASSTGDYNGVCFALPSAEALTVYQQLIRQRRVVRGFLGALTERVTPQIADVFRIPQGEGAIISNLNETMEVDGHPVESPAAKAGLQANDVIVEFNGDRIRHDGDLVRKVAATTVGTEALVRFYRDGVARSVIVTVGHRPSGSSAVAGPVPRSDDGSPTFERERLGFRIETITPRVAREKQLPLGQGCLVLRVEPGSIAEDAELRPGDIIESINRVPVMTTDALKESFAKLSPGEPVVLQVYRESLSPIPRIFLSFDMP
jgi:serine protease Do